MTGSTFKFKVLVPFRIQVGNRSCTREEFFEWLWAEFSGKGLVGVHEGTLLSEQAAEQGMETDSWTVDAGEAPRERDWVSAQKFLDAELFFNSASQAQAASLALAKVADLKIGELSEEKPRDWDAEWKASFLKSVEGVKIPPFWRVLPPWGDAAKAQVLPSEKVLRVNPGAGFGTGTHETTQLCLRGLGEYSLKQSLSGTKALDFGSGSGILAIALGLLGAQVDAVEIDPLAIDNANENARLNQIEDQVSFTQHFPEGKRTYDVVVANILRPVLLEFAEALTDRLSSSGMLVLSGLIDSDVAQVRSRYSALLKLEPAQVLELNEWRSIVWHLDGR